MNESKLTPSFPGPYYCDPEILEREWDRVFRRSWLCAARESQIPESGAHFSTRLGRERIEIERAGDGRLRAFIGDERSRAPVSLDRWGGFVFV